LPLLFDRFGPLSDEVKRVLATVVLKVVFPTFLPHMMPRHKDTTGIMRPLIWIAVRAKMCLNIRLYGINTPNIGLMD
jgi:hypothetical protein